MNTKWKDAALIGWLLWKAFLAFLMFEFRQAWLALLVAWITLRYQHQVVDVEENPTHSSSPSLPVRKRGGVRG